MPRVTKSDIDNIHRNMLRVLEDVGVKVENDVLLDALAGIGARVDRQQQLVRFPNPLVEAFLQECPKVVWEQRTPRLLVRASLYHGRQLDPHTGALTDMTAEAVERYLRLARALPHINASLITGCPWNPHAEREPLYERFYCWKYGAEPSAILYPLEQAPRLLELYQAYAQLKGKAVTEVFSGGVYLLSPLRFSAEEAAQFVWWWSRGFTVYISHMSTAGLSAPVTPAGSVTLHLAEAIAIALIHKACYHQSRLGLTALLGPMDMRTMRRPYGRPEMATANLLFAEMARYYGLSCFLQSGVSDAPCPSYESGAQKAISTLSALQAGADAMIDAGLLNGDCVYSPIQMILDNELAGVLGRFLRPYDCSDEAIGFDAIAEAGPGGLFTGLKHTAERFRDELWEPTVWTRDPSERPSEGTANEDVARALAVYEAIMAEAAPLNMLTAQEECVLMEVIEGCGDQPAKPHGVT